MSGTLEAGRSGFPENPAQAHAGLPLRELLAILRRRQRMILFVVVLLTGIATLIGLQTTRTYTATALVMIQPQQEHVVDVEQVAQGLSGDGAAIETQVKFVQSHENLARTVDKLGLHADSRLVGGDQESGGIVGAIAGLLPSKWLIAAGSAQDPGLEPGLDELRERAIGALRGGLKVEQSGWSYILAVNYTAPDARAAARLANGIADAYVDGQLEHKLSATRRANTWLAERVEELRLRVLESERSAEEYRAAHELAGSDSLSFDAQQIAGLTAQLIDARAERTAKQAKLRRIQELRGDSDPDGVMTADALPSPLIVSLRQQELDLSREEALLSGEYGERHPRIQQLQAEKRRIADRIGQEIENAIRNLEGEIAVAGSREEAIGASLREARGDSAITGQAAVQLRELEREAAANRSLYENFLVRWKETEQQEQIVRSDARVISPARPARPRPSSSPSSGSPPPSSAPRSSRSCSSSWTTG